MAITKPHFAGKVAEASEFAAAWSGGDDSLGLKEVEAFAKSLKKRREPVAKQLGILAKAALVRAPAWPLACLKALLMAPDFFVWRQGEAMMFTSADVKAMEKRLLPQILEAASLMQKAREWFGKSMQQPMAAKLCGEMDVRLVMHVHGFAKKVKTRQQFSSLVAICQKLAASVKQAGGDMNNCPWEPSAAPSAESAPSAVSAQIIKFGADGNIDIAQIKSVFGFELGSTVQLKPQHAPSTGPNTVYHVGLMECDAVEFIAENNTIITVTLGALVDTYRVVKVEADIVVRGNSFLRVENHLETINWCMKSFV